MATESRTAPAFLITYKPRTENRDQGWPAEEIDRLALRCGGGKSVLEPWRFLSKIGVPIGSRVYLLQQGKQGPAIIGYGTLAALPHERSALVAFEKIVRPGSPPLIGRGLLIGIPNSSKKWSTQSSGIRISAEIDELLRMYLNASVIRADEVPSIYVDETALGTDSPEKIAYLAGRYERDEQVRIAVLKRAMGKCEFCGELGFTKRDGTAYLECHHIRALALQGIDRITNVIALCPKHHRRAHFGRDADELEVQMMRILRQLNAGS